MKIRSRASLFTRLRREERGAEAVEFAIVGPMVFFLCFAIIYLLLVLAAQVSVARSASIGVRYASIFDQSAGRYPTAADVNSNVLNNTHLFSSGACTTTTLSGAITPNSPITLAVSCNFPNPAGQAVSGLRSALFGSGGGSEGTSSLVLTASAKARRE